MDYESLSKRKSALPPGVIDAAGRVRLDAWLAVELAYCNGVFEGGALTRDEVAKVVTKGEAAGGRPLVDCLAIANYAEAFEVVRQLGSRPLRSVSEAYLLDLHRKLMRGLNDTGGHYRSPGTAPGAPRVSDRMVQFVAWLTLPKALHPVQFAAEAHQRLVSLDPFEFGTTSFARLVMNLTLLCNDYPPALFRDRDVADYRQALEKLINGDKTPMERLVTAAVGRGFDAHERVAAGQPLAVDAPLGRRLKIGALAKAAGESVPTIRFWTQQGLLKPATTTAAGYALYAPDALDRCTRIQKFKENRLTLKEIRAALVLAED